MVRFRHREAKRLPVGGGQYQYPSGRTFGPSNGQNDSTWSDIGPWLDIGPMWSDLVPKMVNKSLKTCFSRNVPKRFGNGSYNLWGSWEPVFIV